MEMIFRKNQFKAQKKINYYKYILYLLENNQLVKTYVQSKNRINKLGNIKDYKLKR